MRAPPLTSSFGPRLFNFCEGHQPDGNKNRNHGYEICNFCEGHQHIQNMTRYTVGVIFSKASNFREKSSKHVSLLTFCQNCENCVQIDSKRQQLRSKEKHFAFVSFIWIKIELYINIQTYPKLLESNFSQFRRTFPL